MIRTKSMSKVTPEEEEALRDQLHIEIEKKSKACSNATFDCSIPRLDGYEYCIRHILQDSRAPYKQCLYTYPTNNKRCLQAAPKHDGKKDLGLTNYCFEHSRLVQLTKTRNTVGKYKQIESNEAFYDDLLHYIKIDKSKTGNLVSNVETDEEIDVVSPNHEPFAEIDDPAKQEYAKSRILDYVSDSSSDGDAPTLTNTWNEYDQEDSDNESIDSQQHDLIRHSGIYTAEETTVITKQKMVRLQALYMDQILRLNHLLKEKRRKYLHSIRKERETLRSIHDQPKDTPQERRLYEKLKALNHYHKRHGFEAILYKKFLEKRTKAMGGGAHKPPNIAKCIYTEGGVKCGDRTLPCCKYCKKHILEDKKQILFRACGVEKGGMICQEPVPNIFEESTCVLHIKLPVPKNYTLKKYESDTEEEDEEIKKEVKEVDEPNVGYISESQPIEIFPVDDVANNFTINHDQQILNIIEEKATSSPNGSFCEVLFEITTNELNEKV